MKPRLESQKRSLVTRSSAEAEYRADAKAPGRDGTLDLSKISGTLVGKYVTRSKGSELNSPFGDPVYCHHLFASAGSLGPTSAPCVHGGGLDTRLVGEKEPRGGTCGSSTPADQDQQPTSYLLL